MGLMGKGSLVNHKTETDLYIIEPSERKCPKGHNMEKVTNKKSGRVFYNCDGCNDVYYPEELK